MELYNVRDRGVCGRNKSLLPGRTAGRYQHTIRAPLLATVQALEAPVSGRCLSPPSPAAGPPVRGAEHGGNRPGTGALRGRRGRHLRDAADTKEERRVRGQLDMGRLRVFLGFFSHRFAIFLASSSLCLSPPAHAQTSSPPCRRPLSRLFSASSRISIPAIGSR